MRFCIHNNSTLDVLLMYGQALLNVGTENSLKVALDVYTFASQQCPCASTWLGCGIACIELADYVNAETALTEACILDTKNAAVWAYTCILATKLGRADEAEEALEFVLLEDLEDVSLMNAIGTELLAQSMYRPAERILRKSMAVEASPETSRLLADVLVMVGQKQASLKMYTELMGGAGISAEEKAILQERIDSINVEYGLA